MENVILKVGDIIVMKKPHACGERNWQVTRLGADIGLKCEKCGHEIFMDRIQVYKKMKKKVDIKDVKN